MTRWLFSNDYPRSRLLSVLLCITVTALVFAPFIFAGPLAYRTYSSVCLFIILALSYDILLGYTRIISFAHAMFYGIGAYAMAIALRNFDGGWPAAVAGLVLGLLVALALGFAIALFSLRVRAVFFALVTLAVAVGFQTLIGKLYTLTGGADGLAFSVPEGLGPAFTFANVSLYGFDLGTFFTSGDLTNSVFKVRLSGVLVIYYSILASTALIFFTLLRMMNSPFGRVCQAIRENDFRAEALGYRTIVFRTINVCIAAMMAALAGALAALSLGYINPDSTLSFELMVNILLITVIGGMGTLYGAIVGSAVFVVAQNYLQDLLALGHSYTSNIPVLSHVLTPDRWYLWLGVLFVLCVYFFPKGIAGQLRERSARQGVATNRRVAVKSDHPV